MSIPHVSVEYVIKLDFDVVVKTLILFSLVLVISAILGVGGVPRGLSVVFPIVPEGSSMMWTWSSAQVG